MITINGFDDSTSHFVDSSIVKIIQLNRDIIVPCIFSTSEIDFRQGKYSYTEILDINKLDSMNNFLTTERKIYDVISLNKSLKSYDYLYVLQKWCYCYRIYESVFVFNKSDDNPNNNFESIVNRIPELQPILHKYIKKNQTIDALSLSQSQILMLDCVNYATSINEENTKNLFSKYLKVAARNTKSK